jgi:nucleoside phosphorylase
MRFVGYPPENGASYMSSPQSPVRSVVIVTALDLETRAVLRQLGPWTEEVVDGTVLYKGTFADWKVAVVEVGPGNIAVAALASRAIGHCRADVALFVGVAGAVKDVDLGDVVVASKVYGYESGKDTTSGFLPRPDLQHSAHGLEQRARAICKRTQWRDRLDRALNQEKPEIFVGPIAAGEKVVASTRALTAEFLRKQYGDTLAVEMEGRGFLEAVHVNSVLGTVIRGISDRLSGKSIADKAGWPRKAADAASAVAFEILATLTSGSAAGGAAPAPLPHTTPSHPPSGPSAFLEISSTLNEGSFFRKDEVLARVGLKDVDEVLFSFHTLPDAYLRIIPNNALAQPITIAQLNAVAPFAPLLKTSQYGCLTSVNRLGVIAYDPAGPYRAGPAPLLWATQLFPNGELWLASSKMIVHKREGRPSWVPIPFIPALALEQLFFDKLRAALAFAVQHLRLKMPCAVEMGVIGTENVDLVVSTDVMQPIRSSKVVYRESLEDLSEAVVNAALLKFFGRIYDSTGVARAPSLFGFPPSRPR